VECKQEIPECLEPFKPEIQSDTPLFDEDEDEEEDDEDVNPSTAPTVAQGASWDSGDNSVVFQGDAVRMIPPPLFRGVTNEMRSVQ
jgi:hypothetical protein